MNKYALTTSALNFIKKCYSTKKVQIDPNKIIVDDFNTTVTPVDRSSRQKINKET
jgi:hypothetical protein